jgi:hypothetical protein
MLRRACYIQVAHAGRSTVQHSQVDGIISRLTPVMTIMGLLCSPDVARRAQMGELGLDTSQPLQVDRLNAAYGLIAQVVVFLGVILDVPPLFQIVLHGSSCSIQQYIPRFSRHGAVDPEVNEARSPCVCVCFGGEQFCNCVQE